MAVVDSNDFRYMYEMIDSESPGDMTVAPGQTTATVFFIVDYINVQTIIRDILGWSRISEKQWNPGANDPIVGGLQRKIPMSHPSEPSLYAESVEVMPLAADGKWKTDALPWLISYFNLEDAEKSVDFKSFPYSVKYSKIRLKVTFTTRNYFVISDDQLQEAILGDNAVPPPYYWYKKRYRFAANKLQLFSERTLYYDFCEYVRYTTLDVEPQNDIIVQEQGNVFYKSNPIPAVQNLAYIRQNDQNISIANASANFQNITKNLVKIKWHQIPKYVQSNPMYVQAAGSINYGANYNEDPDPAIFNYEFFNFAPGTLLFLGMTSEPSRTGVFLRPMSDANEWGLTFANFTNNFIDITFNFQQYVIPESQIALPNLANIIFWNGKMYSNGWNMYPFSDKIFRYTEAAYRGEPQWPPYWSFPMQKLFNPNGDF